MSIEEWTGYSVPDPILEEASQWIAKLDAKQVTEYDRITFTLWLASDPLHQSAYAELSTLWAHTSVIKNFSHLIEESKVIPIDLPIQSDLSLQQSLPQIESVVWPRLVALSLIAIGFLPPIFTTLL